VMPSASDHMRIHRGQGERWRNAAEQGVNSAVRVIECIATVDAREMALNGGLPPTAPLVEPLDRASS
jgi:hypothetical protein